MLLEKHVFSFKWIVSPNQPKGQLDKQPNQHSRWSSNLEQRRRSGPEQPELQAEAGHLTAAQLQKCVFGFGFLLELFVVDFFSLGDSQCYQLADTQLWPTVSGGHGGSWGGESDAHMRPGFITLIAYAQPALIQTFKFMVCRLQCVLVSEVPSVSH